MTSIRLTSKLGLSTGEETPFVPSGSPVAWFSADSISGNDNDLIQTWTDLTGNGNHLVQDTEAFRPVLKKNIQNGLPAVFMDTAAKFMENNQNEAQPTTVFIVCKRTTTTAGQWFDGLSGRQLFGDWSGTWQAYAGAFLNSGIAVETNTNLWTIKFNGDSGEIRRNGSSIITGSIGFGNSTPLSLGRSGGSSQTGYVFEFIFYGDNQSVAANETGLMTKWGIS